MTHFAHKQGREDFRTPRVLWEPLDKIFHFRWDLMASSDNHLFEKWFSVEHSLTEHYLEAAGESCFSNPAWGKGFKPSLNEVVRLFLELARDHGSNVVALLPDSGGNKWMHDYVLGWAEIIRVRGRVIFDAPDGSGPVRTLNKKTQQMEITPAPFDVCFAWWEPHCKYEPGGKKIRSWDPYGRSSK
jgi:hypothetical protein